MSNQAPLLELVSDFGNLYHAFWECSRGKKSNYEFQRFLCSYGERLKAVEIELKKTRRYQWKGYREFYVHDPKKRLVMAAPFEDRIIHSAIHRMMEPIIDLQLGARTYACRHGKGNRGAALRLQGQLMRMGKHRYCVKLDVKKYFSSVSHEVLYKRLLKALPDESLGPLIQSLLSSHAEYSRMSTGIPIGNLTSQLFANFYLSSVDRLACDELGLDFFNDEQESESFYIRYMDDMVVIAREKAKAFEVANAMVKYAEGELRLNIPFHKRMPLANDPVPFLGFVLDDSGHRVLSRNERKFTKKLRRLGQQGACLSRKASTIQSYEAWKNIDREVEKLKFKV